MNSVWKRFKKTFCHVITSSKLEWSPLFGFAEEKKKPRNMTEKLWKPLAPFLESYDQQIALIILNQPVQPQLKVFKTLWKNAAFKAFVDGGANQVYASGDPSSYIPDLISGDFDSIKAEVLDYYKEKNVEIIETQDQNYTDFTKCLKIVFNKIKSLEIERIIVLGGLGGRFDHQLSNINTLYKMRDCKFDANIQIYLISQTSVVFLLFKGKNTIEINTGFEDEMCGLIPIGGLCEHVTTSGLKYNLDGQQLEFGHLISTSNSYDGSKKPVFVDTNKSLLWTMEMKY